MVVEHSACMPSVGHSACMPAVGHSACMPDVAHSACMPTVEHSACMPDVAHSACVPTVEHSACMLMWNNLASTLSPTLHTKLIALPVPIAIQVSKTGVSRETSCEKRRPGDFAFFQKRRFYKFIFDFSGPEKSKINL